MMLSLQIDLIKEAQDKGLPGAAGVTGSDIGSSGIGPLLSGLLAAVMVIAALLVLLFLVWGAIEWITSGGDSGKAQKAREKITHSIIGIVLLASVLAIFMVIQQFLGIRVFSIPGGTSGGAEFNGGEVTLRCPPGSNPIPGGVDAGACRCNDSSGTVVERGGVCPMTIPCPEGSNPIPGGVDAGACRCNDANRTVVERGQRCP